AALIVALAAVGGTPEKPNRDPSGVDMRRTVAACPNVGAQADVAVGAEPGTTVDINPGDRQVAGSWEQFTVDEDVPTITARSSDGSAAAMAFERATATRSR